MAKISLTKSLVLPEPHQQFNENVCFIVGYYFGTSFHVSGHCDTYDDAVERCLYYNENDDYHHYHIIEVRNQLIFLM